MLTDALCCLFTGTVESDDGEVRLRIPTVEVDEGAIDPGERVRIGLYEAAGGRSTAPDNAAGGEASTTDADEESTATADPTPDEAPPAPKPPVETGEIRYVEIEDIGKRGDGIANVDEGYVIIVPGTDLGDRVKVEIDEVSGDFAMATMIDGPA